MNKFKKLSAMVAALSLIVLGICGCESSSSDDDVTVSIAGQVERPGYGPGPVAWENMDNPVLLPTKDNSMAGGTEAVCVDNGHEYIVGSMLDESGQTPKMLPTIWIDGKETVLPDFGVSGVDSVATSVAVNDGKIYVGGGVGAAGGIALPAEWTYDDEKGWEVLSLPVPSIQQGGLVNDMAIDGNDTYYTGFYQELKENPDGSFYGSSVPCYWKNGVRTDLSYPKRSDTTKSEAVCLGITVHNNDVYVSGTIYYGADGEFIRKPFYWKNGEYHAIVDIESDVDSGVGRRIAVIDGVIKIPGFSFGTGIVAKPVLWSGTEEIRLPLLNEELIGSANGIYVHNNNVYIAGSVTDYTDYETDPKALTTYPCYWKDGTRYDLPCPTDDDGNILEAYGSAIYVTE